MNEQIDNSSPLSLSQALELIKTREGENFSKEKGNYSPQKIYKKSTLPTV